MVLKIVHFIGEMSLYYSMAALKDDRMDEFYRVEEKKYNEKKAKRRKVIEYKKKKEARELNEVYEMLRYNIGFDGTVENYCENYADPYIRWKRLMFLDREITWHTEDVWEHIDCVLSHKKDELQT